MPNFNQSLSENGMGKSTNELMQRIEEHLGVNSHIKKLDPRLLGTRLLMEALDALKQYSREFSMYGAVDMHYGTVEDTPEDEMERLAQMDFMETQAETQSRYVYHYCAHVQSNLTSTHIDGILLLKNKVIGNNDYDHIKQLITDHADDKYISEKVLVITSLSYLGIEQGK